MEYYVGWTCVSRHQSAWGPGRAGRREGVVDSDPEAISVRNVKGTECDGRLETGPTSTWLWPSSSAWSAGICIDARHAKAVLKMQINKVTATMPSGSRAS